MVSIATKRTKVRSTVNNYKITTFIQQLQQAVEDIDKTKSDKKADKSKKNPLAVAMGAFLKTFRDKRDFNAEIISEELGLGAAFYRMIETGTANLHASKIPLLIKLLQNTELKAGNEYDGIIFLRVSAYITALQIFENENNDDDAMDTIATCDETTYKLVKDLEDLVITPLKNQQNPLKKENDSLAIHNKLKEFFIQPLYLGINEIAEKSQNEIAKIINNTPSLFLDFVFDGLKNSQSLQTTLQNINIDVNSWEKINKDRIQNIYGVFSDSTIVVSEHNLSKFQQPFLKGSNFTKLVYYFENISEDEIKKIEEEYYHLLVEMKLYDAKTIADFNNKIFFHPLIGTKEQNYKKNFGDNTAYHILYATTNGNLIGFSHLKDQMPNLRNLMTYKKSIELQELLQK